MAMAFMRRMPEPATNADASEVDSPRAPWVRRWFRRMLVTALALVGITAVMLQIASLFGRSSWEWGWKSPDRSREWSLSVATRDACVFISESTFPHDVSEDHMIAAGADVWRLRACWWQVGAYSVFDLGYVHRGIYFPLWLVALLTLAYPMVVVVYRPLRRNRRRRRGQCAQCGYDVTMIESKRCPECGSPVQPRHEKA